MKELLVISIFLIGILCLAYFILNKRLKNLENKNGSSLVNIIIPVPELSLRFKREMNLHLMHLNHQIFHPELGLLIVEKTMDSCVNENSEQTKLSVYVSMPDWFRSNMAKNGKDYFIERMKTYGFTVCN